MTPRQPQKPQQPDFTKPVRNMEDTNETEGPQAFLCEMNSNLSDSFSYIENDRPLSHHFAFLDCEDQQDIQQNLQKNKQQNPFQNKMNEYLANRDNDPYIGKMISRT